jgi:hypothetical protein
MHPGAKTPCPPSGNALWLRDFSHNDGVDDDESGDYIAFIHR